MEFMTGVKEKETVTLADVTAEGMEGKTVKIEGTVHTIRDMGEVAFLILRRREGLLQCVFEEGVTEFDWKTLKEASGIVAEGVIRKEERAPHGVELRLTGITVLSEPAAPMPLPIAKWKLNTSLDAKLNRRSISLRNVRERAKFRIQEGVVRAFRDFLYSQGFTEIHTPKLGAKGAEGGSNLFRLDYFHRPAVLAQSPQFYKQMAMAAGFERIFETGPVFRAEKSYTNKHATEFSGFDLEFSYITSYKDVMAMEEQLLKAGLQAVKDAYGDQIQELFGKEVIVPETPFPVVKLADLYKGLEEDFGYVVDDSEKGDLTTEAERLSYDWVKKHYNHEFLFVTDYDAEKRAFYHMRDENGVPQGYDLIWRGVEITTGAQREHRYEVLKKQAEEKGLAEDVKFYLEFFQYGCPPHGGFGLGIDRLTMLLVGESIKDAEFLFRGPNRLTP